MVQTGKTRVFIGRPFRNGQRRVRDKQMLGRTPIKSTREAARPTGVERSETPLTTVISIQGYNPLLFKHMATAARARREASGKGPPPYAVSGLAALLVPPKTSGRRESSDVSGGTNSTASPDTAEGAPARRLRRGRPRGPSALPGAAR